MKEDRVRYAVHEEKSHYLDTRNGVLNDVKTALHPVMWPNKTCYLSVFKHYDSIKFIKKDKKHNLSHIHLKQCS